MDLGLAWFHNQKEPSSPQTYLSKDIKVGSKWRLQKPKTNTYWSPETFGSQKYVDNQTIAKKWSKSQDKEEDPKQVHN